MGFRFFFNFFFNFLIIFERGCEQQRGKERQGDTDSEAGSRLSAGSTEPDAGLELTNCKVMT